MKLKIRDWYSTWYGRLIIAASMTAVLFLVLYWKSYIVFFINDDENIMYTLAGYYTGGNTADHSFVNFFLSAILQGLYRLVPGLPWYGIFHVMVLFSSITAIGTCIMKEGNRWGIQPLLCIVLFGGMQLLCFLYPMCLMQFTTTSALAGTAAVALLFTSDLNQNQHWWISGGLSVLFLLICYCHRKNTGSVILCFYALVVAYKTLNSVLIHHQNKLKVYTAFLNRFTICFLAALLCISSAAFVSQGIVRSSADWDYFYQFDEARYKVTDYPHDSYQENPEMYDSLGWTEPLYKLATMGYWFFMDEHVNAESFDTISETGYQNTDSSLKQCLVNFKSLLATEHLALVLFLLMLLFLCVATVLGFLHIKEAKWELLLCWCAVGGAALMSFYLCWKGRFLLRAFQVIMYPTLVLLFLTIIMMLKNREYKSQTGWKRWIAVCGAVLVLCGVFGVGNKLFQETRLLAYDRVVKSSRTLLLESYAMEHPENVYIYDTSLTFRYAPFVTYTEEYPSNLIFWGGMGWKSPAFYEQLQLNGLDELYSDVLFEEGVYYVSYTGYLNGSGQTILENFLPYMQMTFGDFQIEAVDTVSSDITVFRFSK